MEITTQSAQATEALGQKIGLYLKENFPKGAVIALYGDLGSGKTTLTRGLAKGFGVRGRITSPTFIIARQHQFSPAAMFHHLDFYRLESEADFKELGLKELFAQTGNFIVIEWAEKGERFLPPSAIRIYCQYQGPARRRFKIQPDLALS